MNKRRIHLLFTGGTISMRLDPVSGAAVPALSGDEILAHVPGLRREAMLSVEDYARLPGPHVTPEWMWRLRGRVQQLLDDKAVDGIVIAHGTDTLEETAYLLDLTLDSPRPVVFCGSMRTVSDPGWDGPANIVTAVRAAADPESFGRGVLVAIGEEIHGAAEVTKWHTQHLDAFRSTHGPLGVVERGRAVYHRPAFRTPVIPSDRIVTAVDLHVAVSGCDDGALCASLDRGARGIVIEAMGCGNVPPGLLPGIRKALAASVPVVVVSRSPEGRVTPVYGYEGGGRMLREMGVVFGPELPGPKARIKLMVALGRTSDRAVLRLLFEG